MQNHDGTACYSFALDKEGCVTQLPCVFGAALRDDTDDSSELICFAAAARSLSDSVGTPLGESVGAPSVDGPVGVEMNGILTHATSVALSPTTATTTELTAAQIAETNAAIYVKANAKNPGTKSFARYAKYQSARSAKEYAALGGSRADLRHDLRKSIVVVGTPPVDLFGGLRVPQPRRISQGRYRPREKPAALRTSATTHLSGLELADRGDFLVPGIRPDSRTIGPVLSCPGTNKARSARVDIVSAREARSPSNQRAGLDL